MCHVSNRHDPTPVPTVFLALFLLFYGGMRPWLDPNGSLVRSGEAGVGVNAGGGKGRMDGRKEGSRCVWGIYLNLLGSPSRSSYRFHFAYPFFNPYLDCSFEALQASILFPRLFYGPVSTVTADRTDEPIYHKLLT